MDTFQILRGDLRHVNRFQEHWNVIAVVISPLGQIFTSDARNAILITWVIFRLHPWDDFGTINQD
jgi:hypothetical protein